MAGFIEAMRATLTDLSGDPRRTPPPLPAWLPATVQPAAAAGLQRLLSYQGASYAQLYLDRLRRFAGRKAVSDGQFGEIARLLALRMSYQDPIELSRAALAANARGDVTDVVHRLELDELVTAWPAVVSEQLLDALEWAGWRHRRIAIRFSSRSRFGRLRLALLAALRRWRPLSPRYARERALTERWLHMIDRCLTRQPEAVDALIASADLLQGCGASYRSRLAAWNLIIDRLAKPVFDGALRLPDLAAALAMARTSVSDDPVQLALRQKIAQIRNSAAPATG